MAISRRQHLPALVDHAGTGKLCILGPLDLEHKGAPHGGGPRLMRALLLAALITAGIAGCAARPDVEVGLIGLAPVESTLFEQRLRLDFRLQNFSERVVSATGFELTLNVNGRPLARGVDSGAFRLERLGEARVSAVVSTSLFDVARQLLELPDREEFDYELTGRLYLDGWPRSLPFSRSGRITRDELARLTGAGNREPQPLRLD